MRNIKAIGCCELEPLACLLVLARFQFQHVACYVLLFLCSLVRDNPRSTEYVLILINYCFNCKTPDVSVPMTLPEMSQLLLLRNNGTSNADGMDRRSGNLPPVTGRPRAAALVKAHLHTWRSLVLLEKRKGTAGSAASR